MNQRIRELIEQAISSRIQHDPKTMMTERVQEFDKEKFAELIVRECAELVETQHTWITSVAASALIRKHFGVEECTT